MSSNRHNDRAGPVRLVPDMQADALVAGKPAGDQDTAAPTRRLRQHVTVGNQPAGGDRARALLILPPGHAPLTCADAVDFIHAGRDGTVTVGVDPVRILRALLLMQAVEATHKDDHCGQHTDAPG